MKRATRIVEEWPELDAEIMRLQEKVAKENITGKTFTVEIDGKLCFLRQRILGCIWKLFAQT